MADKFGTNQTERELVFKSELKEVVPFIIVTEKKEEVENDLNINRVLLQVSNVV